MNDKKIINYKGQEVWCYGDLKGRLTEECTIDMVYSGINGRLGGEGFVDNWNYTTEKPFSNWTECVRYLIDLERFDNIEQLVAIK